MFVFLAVFSSVRRMQGSILYQMTREWVKQGKASERTVSALQTVSHKLAELKTSIIVCRVSLDQCLELHNEGRLDGEMASMAKYWATDLENKVAADCLQLHGGWGFMWETNIAKGYADARVQTIYGGTNEIMKEFYQLMEQLPQERLIIAVHSAAHAEVMFEETRDWFKQKKAFGRTVSALQTVQHKLAELRTSIVVCRAFIDQCLELHNEGRLDGKMANMAKHWATDLENKVWKFILFYKRISTESNLNNSR